MTIYIAIDFIPTLMSLAGKGASDDFSSLAIRFSHPRSNSMRIHSWRSILQGEWRRISATIDDREVFVNIPRTLDPEPLGDPFLVASLVRAMSGGGGSVVRVDETMPVSASLFESLGEYQTIYREWCRSLETVSIEAPRLASPRPSTGRVACLYSGGIDSLYSIGSNLDSITHLVLQRGFDIPFNETERWGKMVSAGQLLAEQLGKTLIILETNMRAQCLAKTMDNHGAILIAPTLLLGVDRLIVPASDSAKRLTPWGSHPLTDPLLSNVFTKVVHHGVVTRCEKTRFVVEWGAGLSDLRVCNRFAEYNCGSCEKCIRTMAILHLYGGASPTLPQFHPRMLRSLELWSEGGTQVWRDIQQIATLHGDNGMSKEVTRLLLRFDRKELLRRADALFAGGSIQKLIEKVKGRRATSS